MMRLALGILAATALFGQQSALDPAGPGAGTIRTLGATFLGLLGLIFLIVIVLALVPLVRRDRGIGQEPLTETHQPSPRTEQRFTIVVSIATAATILTLIGLVILSVSVGTATSGPLDRSHSLVIEVTGN